MLFYNFIITLLFILLRPYFFIQFIIKNREWKWRLGLAKFPYTKRKRIWIHASSVGEINGISSLINKFVKANPECFIYLSTMTITGQERAKQIALNHSQNIFPFLFPLDVPLIMMMVLSKIKPKLLILTETEIWPVLIFYAKKMSCKILLINARLSEKSVRNYNKLKVIFNETISKIDFISAQSEIDKDRFSKFGNENMTVNGNLKFALSLPEFENNKIRNNWNIKSELVITFGSSRPGEEELVAELHKYLISQGIKHQIIIAPRHLNRLPEIEKILKNYNIKYAKLSTINNNYDILLIDKMGELTKAYSISDIAIIGGSFYDFGGHNPLEAAYFGMPILMGKFHQSCRKTVEILMKYNAIEIVDKDDLNQKILYLCKHPEIRKKMGNSAKMVMERNKDSLKKTLKAIERYL
ncbi:MAG: 3-deoxy-D-manno-octulosonic acid transferase [Candidatus Cloacimonetes bacterium]|nr:3-deoxy-D-manno-octulosonic acid transferase [Candidatus Cloacimonadota bacterium]